MFFDGSFFFFKEFCRPLSEEHSCKKKEKKKNAIQLAVWEEKIFKGFLLWLPWQPELFMEHNYLNLHELQTKLNRISEKGKGCIRGETNQ